MDCRSSGMIGCPPKDSRRPSGISLWRGSAALANGSSQPSPPGTFRGVVRSSRMPAPLPCSSGSIGKKGNLRTYLWLRDLDYVVVLTGAPPASPRYYFLITAFHLSGDSQRRNMRRRYEEREP